MNQQEYIKTAQELAKLPGTEKWPTRFNERRGKTKTRFTIQLFSDSMRVEYPTEHGRFTKQGEWIITGYNHGPFLPLHNTWVEDDEWTAPKMIERMGIRDLDGMAFLGQNMLETNLNGIIATVQEANQIILEVGQKAHGIGLSEYEDQQEWLDAWNRGQDVPA